MNQSESSTATVVESPVPALPRGVDAPELLASVLSGVRAFYLKTRIYLAFTAWFYLVWMLGEHYDFLGAIDVFYIEYPFTLYLFYLFNQVLRPSRWRPMLAALPVFGIYAIHDIHYLFFNAVPTLAQFGQVPELFMVGDLWMRSLLIFLGLGILWFISRQVVFSLRTLRLTSPLLLFLGALFLAPAMVVKLYDSAHMRIDSWLEAFNSARNGRLTTAIYSEAKRRVALSHLESYAQDGGQRQRHDQVITYLKENVKKDRQVFVVLLESFLDPRLLKPYAKRSEYLDDNFRRLYDKGLSFSISPKFGGGTAQAEFEVLCGVPAMAEFDEVEFNLFSGAATPCLPQVLSEVGYDTIANDPYIPAFFNVKHAYPGLGFKEVYYAKQHTDQPTYLSLEPGHKYLFDGALFQQNRGFLEERQSAKPLFNYVLTLYGHMYYDVQRPHRWNLGSKDPDLEKIANISYYRSGPLAEYLQWLSQKYPKSIIVALADHLPFFGTGPESYKAMGYLDNVKDSIYYNRALVIKDGKPVKLPTFHHFSVPAMVYDYLTDGGYCKRFDCNLKYPVDKEKLREDYRYVLARASQDKDPDPQKPRQGL